MKYPHRNKMKLPHLHKQKPRYEYELPKDEIRLVADACALADMRAVSDFPTEYTREEVEAHAVRGCENMKSITKAQELTNDYDRLLDIVKQHYIEGYLLNISEYKRDSTLYEKHIKRMKEIGWITAYNSLRKILLRQFEEHYLGVQ